jgi:hypothetical protein
MKFIQKYIPNTLIIAALLTGALAINSCSDLATVNVNTKVNNESTPDALFASATKNLVDLQTSTNQNYNPFRLWAQHWTETTYTDEANYNVVSRTIPDRWFDILYVRVLENYESAKSIESSTNPTGDQAQQANRLAILDIMEVYTYSTLVELFGDVPYSEATKIGTTLLPKYDNQATIYADLIARLYKDIQALNTNSSAANFGSSDLVYSGKTSAWQKFANSLLLRMGMMLTDVPSGTVGTYTATKLVQDALAGGVFTSNSDNALFQYLGSNPNTNPLYVDLVQSGRQDYVACKTFINPLIANNDLRYTVFFSALSSGAYAGGAPGSSTSTAKSSYPGDLIQKPTLAGVLLTYAETELLQAEAATRGIGGLTSSSATTHYNNGIQASIDYWAGLSGISLSSTSGLINTTYAYPTTYNDQMKAIAFQLWIALYNQGFEAWTQWRRLDYPTLTIPSKIYNAAVNNGIKTVPKRFTYPASEAGTNSVNLDKAASDIGGDNLYTPLFWDKYNNQWGTNNQNPALAGN